MSPEDAKLFLGKDAKPITDDPDVERTRRYYFFLTYARSLNYIFFAKAGKNN